MKHNKDLSTVIIELSEKGIEFNCVYDIGAHRGIWTRNYSKMLPGAQFHLFEANPNRKEPIHLSQKHKWHNVVLSKPGMGKVDFYSINRTGDSYKKELTDHYKNCETMVLDTQTLDSMDLPDPQLIKLDTQGSELDILRGADKALDSAKVIMVEIPVTPYNEGAPTFNDLVAFLNWRDFVPVGVHQIHKSEEIIIHFDMVLVKRETI